MSDQLSPELLDEGTRNHMMADILAVNANGKAVETIDGKNRMLSAYGEHSKELISKKCLWVETHEMGSSVIAHGVIAQTDWAFIGNLSGLTISITVFVIMITGWVIYKCWPKKTQREQMEDDEAQMEALREWEENQRKNKKD